MGVSLRDLARHAGVSVATVSNVVNGYRPVAELTRVKVQQAIDELGYSPNLSARHLRLGRTGFLALAIPELNNPYFAELADAAMREASRHGYTVLIDHTNGLRERELALSQGMRPQVIDGLIFSPVQLDAADLLSRTSEVPLVLVGERIHGAPYDHVAIDNVAASRVAVGHLLGLGRRRIAFVGASEDSARQPAGLRLDGYRQTLREAGLPLDSGLVVTTAGFDRADGARGMRRLLEQPERPDAVFAYNDLIAVGAMRVAYEHGLRIPEDLAVVGFDDIDEGRYHVPTLTTVSPDKEEIARRAVRSLVRRLEQDPDAPAEEIQVPFALIARESTTGRTRTSATRR